MNAILAKIDELEKELDGNKYIPFTVFITLSELREQVRNYKCIHDIVSEYANNTTGDYDVVGESKEGV